MPICEVGKACSLVTPSKPQKKASSRLSKETVKAIFIITHKIKEHLIKV
jgi:hypothetical protein